MKISNKRLAKVLCGLVAGSVLWTGTGLAAPADNDIDSQIAEQQRILKELNDKKSQSQSKEMQDKLSKIEKQLTDLKNKPSYDAQGAIEAIAGQIVELRRQIEATTETQAKIAEILDKLEKRDKEEKAQAVAVADNAYNGTAATRKFLVNPGGQGSDVGFTQDAINSQGNSTMIFSYAPNQLYKIYCRKGYLTDLAFKKGESIQFVGGGDTAGWMVSDSTVDGVPHLYIKPMAAPTRSGKGVGIIIPTAITWHNSAFFFDPKQELLFLCRIPSTEK